MEMIKRIARAGAGLIAAAVVGVLLYYAFYLIHFRSYSESVFIWPLYAFLMPILLSLIAFLVSRKWITGLIAILSGWFLWALTRDGCVNLLFGHSSHGISGFSSWSPGSKSEWLVELGPKMFAMGAVVAAGALFLVAFAARRWPRKQPSVQPSGSLRTALRRWACFLVAYLILWGLTATWGRYDAPRDLVSGAEKDIRVLGEDPELTPEVFDTTNSWVYVGSARSYLPFIVTLDTKHHDRCGGVGWRRYCFWFFGFSYPFDAVEKYHYERHTYMLEDRTITVTSGRSGNTIYVGPVETHMKEDFPTTDSTVPSEGAPSDVQ